MQCSRDYFLMKHPFTMIVAGPTSSGKTILVRRLLDDWINQIKGLLSTPKCVWCYGQWQSEYNNILSLPIEYHEGLVDETSINEMKPDIIVIDDLMTELGDNKSLANLFTKGSHHMNLSVIFIIQNIFHQAKMMRTISLNCHYFYLMKNARDRSQIVSLARQLYPNNMKYLVESYENATKKPYSYIRVDTSPMTPDEYRVRTRLLQEELPLNYKFSFAPFVYQQKNV